MCVQFESVIIRQSVFVCTCYYAAICNAVSWVIILRFRESSIPSRKSCCGIFYIFDHFTFIGRMCFFHCYLLLKHKHEQNWCNKKRHYVHQILSAQHISGDWTHSNNNSISFAAKTAFVRYQGCYIIQKYVVLNNSLLREKMPKLVYIEPSLRHFHLYKFFTQHKLSSAY